MLFARLLMALSLENKREWLLSPSAAATPRSPKKSGTDYRYRKYVYLCIVVV